MPGTYTFKPIEAKLTHDTSILSRMDPYCLITAGNMKAQSQICKKGGKHPHWSDSLTIPIPNDLSTKVKVQLMDRDRILVDDTIGSFEMDLKEVQDKGMVSRWYPLSYNNESAGEILIETFYKPEISGVALASAQKEGLISSEKSTHIEHQEPPVVFTEQKQVVEPCTFTKEVESVEIRSGVKDIEVMEPVKVTKEVPVTEPVTITKLVEVTKPEVVTKEVEVMEPRLVTKTIQVVEDVPVMKEVQVVELKTSLEEVQTVEPQTTMKEVEVIEYRPVHKEVTVSEPVTVKKSVEYVEPIITTKTVTKEIPQAVVVDEKITTTVGPATVLDIEKQRIGERQMMREEIVGAGVVNAELVKKEVREKEVVVKEKIVKEKIEEEAIVGDVEKKVEVEETMVKESTSVEPETELF